MKMARREAPSRLRARLEDLPLSKSALRTEVSLKGSADSLPSGKSAGYVGNHPHITTAY